MGFVWACLGFALGTVALYIGARLITAAYFRSRADYEKRMNHGKG